MYPPGVGSGETAPVVTAHTAGNTPQSTPRIFCVASADSSSALGFSLATAGRNPVQENKKYMEYQGNNILLDRPGESCATQSQQHS